MNQVRSSYSQSFIVFQYIIACLLIYLYIQNNIISVLPNLHGNDFSHNYIAAYLLREGGNPYNRIESIQTAQSFGIERLNPYVYPLFVGYLFIPLTFFPYNQAKLIWFFINHILFISTILIFLKTIPKIYRPMTGILFLGLSILYYPLIRTLTAGQLNILMFFFIVLVWYGYANKKMSLAGIVLGLSIMVKVFTIFFLLYFLIKKEYRLVASTGLTLLIILLITVNLSGWDTTLDYYQLLKSMSYGQSVWSDITDPYYVDPANQSIHAMIYRVMTINPLIQKPWFNLPFLAKICSILISASLLLTSLFYSRKIRSGNNPYLEPVRFAFALLSFLLIPSLMWDHYLLYILFILIILLIYETQIQSMTSGKILSLTLIYLWIAVPFNFWDSTYRSGYQILWISFKLYPVLLLWLYLVHILRTKGNFGTVGI